MYNRICEARECVCIACRVSPDILFASVYEDALLMNNSKLIFNGLIELALYIKHEIPKKHGQPEGVHYSTFLSSWGCQVVPVNKPETQLCSEQQKENKDWMIDLQKHRCVPMNTIASNKTARDSSAIDQR